MSSTGHHRGQPGRDAGEARARHFECWGMKDLAVGVGSGALDHDGRSDIQKLPTLQAPSTERQATDLRCLHSSLLAELLQNPRQAPETFKICSTFCQVFVGIAPPQSLCSSLQFLAKGSRVASSKAEIAEGRGVERAAAAPAVQAEAFMSVFRSSRSV